MRKTSWPPERRQDLCLPLEAGATIRVIGQLVGEYLQRNEALQLDVPGPIHVPHSSRTNGGKDLVCTKESSRGEGHDKKRLILADRSQHRDAPPVPKDRFVRHTDPHGDGRVVIAGAKALRLSPMPDLPQLDIRDGQKWRRWLKQHHAVSPGIWLVFHKAHTGVSSIPYEEAVCHALCFGWVDSLIKRLDADRFALKFTPRKPTSKWSDINRKRWADLKQQGLLTPAGLEAAPTSNCYGPRPTIPVLPAYVATALKKSPKAWRFFQALPPTERRNFVVWIHIAKRPETRARRLRESIVLLTAGKRLGLK
jgi:uncharacterized protein YdeI (YjbR/CyaY-like superfamily)